MDWDKLRIFYAVARTNSLTRAAEMLGVSQSAISRQVAGLEDRLKVPLFVRHSRGLLLTEQGEILYQTVCQMVGKLEAAEMTIADSGTRPKGPLRVAAPVAFGSIWLASRLKEFLALYPEIELSLYLDDREFDLTRREADVAIRMSPCKQPDLIQVTLTDIGYSAYASNDYLQECGMPLEIEELKAHRLLAYPDSMPLPTPCINWLFDLPGLKNQEIKPYLQLNSLNAMRRAVKAGIGIATLPDYIMYKAKHISKVLPQLKSPVTPVYYTYPLEMKSSRRVGVFRSFLERKIGEHNF